MKVSRLIIENFRGIKSASLFFPDHVVLIGDNNVGKTTVFEALDLVLGPDRLGRRPVVDEHDFYHGAYLATTKKKKVENDEAVPSPPVIEVATTTVTAPEVALINVEEGDGEAPKITVEATITGLSDEQLAHFNAYIEWWDKKDNKFYEEANPAGVDAANILPALRVTFIGNYDPEEDDFEGNSYYTRSLDEAEKNEYFSKRDKQRCGFLYLRSVRTGSRALSLDHGSLLDIILRLKEIRPQMWEDTIESLSKFDVAADEKAGISDVLNSLSASLRKFVPREWGVNPHLKVSMLTRDHLRKVVTAFIATGDGTHAAPFFRQGTGTINMLVLAMLSQIAEAKQNVIFAMEEPETAIPPYAQKRIIHEICKLSAQSMFTSHSPYVLEEFSLNQTVILSRTSDGVLTMATIKLPESVKHKRYRQEFRTRFCEGLLSRRVLIAEGATEATAFPVAARRLHELAPKKYKSLEALGICVIDAGSDSQIVDLGELYRSLGKKVYACCDKQTDESKVKIEDQVDKLFMHNEHRLEDLVLKTTTAAALQRFCKSLDWPAHLQTKYPDPAANAAAALRDYFKHSKGNWGIADFLAQCNEAEIPEWIRKTCQDIATICAPEEDPTETEAGAEITKAELGALG
jgi:putative ATP-dependent endonuclease of the OLD family